MKYYRYNTHIQNTLLPLTTSRYAADIGGSPCWVFTNEYAPFGVTLTGLQSATNISLELYVDYYDDDAGYIRIQYDDGGVLTAETVVELLGDDLWKTVTYSYTGRLNNILSDGDFRLFASSTEGTTADQALRVRRVAVNKLDAGTVATWQTIGLETVSKRDFQDVMIVDPKQVITLKSPDTTLSFNYGMKSFGVADGSTTPLYVRASRDNDTYWRDTGGVSTDLTVTYFDNGTDDIEASYYTDTEENTKIVVTKGNTQTWKTATVAIPPLPAGVDGDFSVFSDTSNAADPIIDSGQNAVDVTLNGSPEPAHDPTEAKLGLSSIEFNGSNYAYIDPADTGFLDFGTDAFTVMLWFNSTGTYHQNIITNNPDGTYNGFMLHIYYDDFYIYSVDGGRWEITGATHGIDMNDGTWHHIALSSDGAGNLYLHLDGTQYYTRTYTSIAYSATHGLYIGGDAWAYTGHIQDIYVNKGTALFTDTFSLPTTLMVDDPTYAVGAQSAIRYNGEYTTQEADLKLTTSAGSPLYIAELQLASENNAEVVWRP